MSEHIFLTTGDAARIIGCSAESVRLYEHRGILKAQKTGRGMRLFRMSDVQDLVYARGATRKRLKAEKN